ncbi:uncharacterized protein LOC107037456 [Diachasma alloeum]|uniref:uncharacterized protein LOC107037456 n=1 Tax=Diachasma alloeum TaxID=454923 RepID=UPI0007383550|nr:uncharacterized protein LOC107037456 [Diachasma alloeum]
MEHSENEALKSAAQKPAVWFRYVDDTFVIWSHGRTGLNQFLEFLNAQHPSIKFTMKIEQNGCLPFLDVSVRCNEDGTLSHQVYRKPTHTDRYLNAASRQHPSQKNSVISSLMYRALTISQSSNVNSEVEHLETALAKNGYNIQQIRKVKR